MGLISVRLPRFCTGPENKKPCSVTVYVNNLPHLYCYSDSTAVFEAKGTCQVAFLFEDVNIKYPIPFYQDLVISGTMSPDKQYEIIQTDTAFEITEVETK